MDTALMASDVRGELRTVGIAALLVSLSVGLISNVVFFAAFDFRMDWFREPTRLLGAGSDAAELLRWAAVLDLIGYYLASAVLAYVLWRMLRPRNATVADLSMLGGISFAVAGGSAAAVLAMVGPMLLHDHAAATSASDQAAIAVQFRVLFELVWRSIWQLVDGIFVAAWWLGIALLVRRDQLALWRLTLTLAVVGVVGAILNLLGLGLGRDIALGVVFILWTAWWIWLLVLLRRGSPPFSD
ncbi:MAG: hypothetical protein KY392_06840, partial [Chloroflexi bacterium]|nr:hypothetical protein [Chloroflexota bacterium]